MMAYNIIRRYTGWGMAEAKEYVENDFKTVIKIDSIVRCVKSDKQYHVRATLKRGGEIFYWCEPKDVFGVRDAALCPKTYRSEDITLSLI